MTDPATTQLAGITVVTLALNLPGPLAAARLASMGAAVTKVEPPAGDPLSLLVTDYYAELIAQQTVRTMDLKSDAGRAEFRQLLVDADVLITAQRPASLARLGLDDFDLPRLCQVRIVGHRDDPDAAGHDLTYQASAGLLQPPMMPTVLVADLVGAERTVSAALAALVQRSVTNHGSTQTVVLEDAATFAAGPVRHHMTGPGRALSGTLPGYNVYRAADGEYVALAALERHFWDRFAHETGAAESVDAVAAVFESRPASEWEAWAAEHDIPLARVCPISPS